MSTTGEAVVKSRYIIEDVVLKILQQLPVKSLLRFKCVCKSWYNLINSPTFIAMHLNRSESDYTNKDHKDHFVSLFVRRSSICFFSYDTFEFSSNLGVAYPRFRCYLVSIVGSCDGLLCLWDTEHHYLMNPATRDVKRLAMEPALPPDMDHAYGFGYDPKAETYKLVRVALPSKVGVALPSKVHVFSLRKGGWRLIVNSVLKGVSRVCERWSRAVMKNVAHWCVTLEWEVGRGQFGIAAFNFSDQVFKDIIRLPESLKYCRSRYREHRCCVVKDCLSMGAILKGNRSIELWVMKEYGVEGSWTKLYRVDCAMYHSYGGVKQLEFGLHGEALVYEYQHLLVLHPPSGKDFQIVFGRNNSIFKGIFVNYRESLLRLPSPCVRKLEAKLVTKPHIFKVYNHIGTT